MYSISGRNVNDIYFSARSLIAKEGILQDSRAGKVLALPGPVLTCYERPLERVLFDPKRDANPWFHVVEGIWMLAGQRDARMLDRFVKDFSTRFAEDDGMVHGAYGYRWKNWFHRYGDDGLFHKIDQLVESIRLLRSNPNDRQVVIQMWDTETDLGIFGLADRPCNTQIYLRIVDGALDLTTTARSHDMIFGATGANAVHFTILQEYLAAGIGCEVGRFYQFSNNYHAYEDVFAKTSHGDVAYVNSTNYYDAVKHPEGTVTPYPMVQDFADFDRDVAVFLEGDWTRPDKVYVNRWFPDVLCPMVQAHTAWKDGNRRYAIDACGAIVASDWRLACRQWMERRMKK